jgi:pimeloyl-ACP methyl ester carboxylesterase
VPSVALGDIETREVVAGAGHLFFREAPEVTLRLLDEFLL